MGKEPPDGGRPESPVHEPRRESVFAGGDVVAVGDEESFAVEQGFEGFVVDMDSALRLEIAVGPHVVVAGEEVDFHPPVGQLRQGAEQPGETFRDDAPVFVPEIEQISYEEDGFGIGGNPPQPSDEQFFAFPRLLRR